MRKLGLMGLLLAALSALAAGQEAAPPAADDSQAANTMNAMAGAMAMGPHMYMTALRPKQPEDDATSATVLAAARTVMVKYQDYHTALADDFKIFLPDVPQKQYHFTNYANGLLNQSSFDPSRPTSLLYDLLPGGGYKLMGVMYTAPKSFSEDELNQRIPLSVAMWHEHTNFCVAPRGRKTEYFPPSAKFGLIGSISTKEACEAEGGSFRPVVFNWMVHIYPNNKGHEFAMEEEHGH